MTKKIALISGANKGIGKEAARQLGKKGFKVYVGARDLGRGSEAVQELKADGIDAEAIQLDVTDQSSVDKAIATIAKDNSQLDVLVNNAGILVDRGTDLESASVDDVHKTMETNFYGPIRLLKAATAILEKSEAPRVVNVSSTLGSLNFASDPASPFAEYTYLSYNCSKSALNMFTIIASKCLKNRKFKVNSICPGYVATDINENKGYRTVEQGAAVIVKMATLGDDGPTGGFFNDDGAISW